MSRRNTVYYEPAFSILMRLGGTRLVSEALGVPYPTVCGWRTASTRGRIAIKYWDAIFKLAEERGVVVERWELAEPTKIYRGPYQFTAPTSE